jgi:hypothetical protein
MNKWFHILKEIIKFSKFENYCVVNDHEIINYYSINQEISEDKRQKQKYKSEERYWVLVTGCWLLVVKFKSELQKARITVNN